MNYREARKIAQRADKQLRLPRETSLETIQRAIELSRNRSISVEEVPTLTGADMGGLWLVMQDRDLILHAPARSPWHRQQIILHEFSHMILHHDVQGIGTSLTGQLLPGLDSRMVLRVLGRSSYETDAELTAEALADRLAARIIRGATSAHNEPLSFGEVFG